MNGAGNKILVLDLRGADLAPSAGEARAINRALGLDYDQMMVLTDPRTAGAAAYVLIYNNDGSLAGACGNGARCVADRLSRELGAAVIQLETAAGLIACERLGPAAYRVDMGAPRLTWLDVPLAHAVDDTRLVSLDVAAGDPLAALGPAAVASMGNPHAAFFVRDLTRIDAAALGARVETHPMFPEKVNVAFAEVGARNAIAIRVWERGVGLTRACGSAACATLVSAARRGLTDRKAVVRQPGGELVIEWRPADGHVLMTGPVEDEGEFVLDNSLFEAVS